MKKFLLSLLFIPFLLTGCGGSSGGGDTPPAEPSINVPISEVSIIEGEEFQIEIEILKPTIVICRSNNEEIATVTHSGLISALKEGETTITISGGQDHFLVFVTVLENTAKSSLSIEMPKNRYTLKEGDEFLLPLTVKYGTEIVSTPTLTYEYEYEDIISIEDYSVTALSAGTTKVVVTASYDDLEVSEIFTIVVY